MGTTNLPLQSTSFIGRERELEKIARLLENSRLITIAGPGGCGKTRLALRAADTSAGRFPDGVWIVELEALDDPALILPCVLQTLSIPPHARPPGAGNPARPVAGENPAARAGQLRVPAVRLHPSGRANFSTNPHDTNS